MAYGGKWNASFLSGPRGYNCFEGQNITWASSNWQDGFHYLWVNMSEAEEVVQQGEVVFNFAAGH
jgi:hypothetical protein